MMPESFSRRNLLQGIGTGALLSSRSQAAPAELLPNEPVGTARGLHPGRVVWTHNAKAARWGGSGDGHWWEPDQTDETAVDDMMSSAIRHLGGESTSSAAWNALFRQFNQARGNGSAGFVKGEKVMIKVNLVGCIGLGRNVDPETYSLVRQPDYMNTSPQLIVALLRQLAAAGVPQQDISVGDSLAMFPKQYVDICRCEFPDVVYLDRAGGNAAHPRTKVAGSSVALYWSQRPEGVAQDYVPAAYAEATYLINVANLKSHTMAGVTLGAKNHYGSLIRTPPQKGYFNIHDSLPRGTPGPGRYRALVDLMGHAHLGAKTLVSFIDGLYPGVHPIEASPRKWASAPFNGNWASSLLASQDPVALDSVAFDFLWTEWNDYPRMPGADDYLHEAAQAGNPPSGTFYDPNHASATTRLSSLGVHEHWNNPVDRKYSRNLGRKEGIELIALV